MKKFSATSVASALRRRRRKAATKSSDAAGVSSRRLQAEVEKTVGITDSAKTCECAKRKNLRSGDNTNNNVRKKKGVKSSGVGMEKTRTGEGPADACLAKKVRKKSVSAVTVNKSNATATPQNRDRRSQTQRRTSTSSMITGPGMPGCKMILNNQTAPQLRSGSTISYDRNSSTTEFKGRSSTISISSRIFSSSSRAGTAHHLSSSSEKPRLKEDRSNHLQKTQTDIGLRPKEAVSGAGALPPRSNSITDVRVKSAGLDVKTRAKGRKLGKSNEFNSSGAGWLSTVRMRGKNCRPPATRDGECESSVCTDSCCSE